MEYIQKNEIKSIQETVARIIGDHLGLPPSTLKLDSHITNDLGGDSFDHIELMITIEERFGIKIPNDQINKLQRICDIISYLELILSQESKDFIKQQFVDITKEQIK